MCELPKIVTYTEAENTTWPPRAEGMGNGESLFSGGEVPVTSDKSGLKMSSTTQHLQFTVQECAPEHL